MNTNSSNLSDVITISEPLIKSVVDIFITPLFEKFRKKFSLDRKVNYVPTEEHFKEYFSRTYNKLSFITTIVFKNSQKLLKDIYVPLTIRTTGGGSWKQVIDRCPLDILKKYRKLLITDTAGMGKSTMMKRIFIDAIDTQCGIPIFLELRRLSKNKTILNEISEQLNSLTGDFDEELMFELINMGGFLFILDGYDEIPSAEKEIITKDVQGFIEKAQKNYFILTSRPENSLNGFGAFLEFTIERLTIPEAFILISNYDNNGRVSKLLLKELKKRKVLNSISEFLVNPLLVSLLYSAFDHKNTIPFKKHVFYRQVFDANFELHDLTKDSYIHEKVSGLEIDDFHRVLRYMGYASFKAQKVEFLKDQLLDSIEKAKSYYTTLKFSNSDFLKDLIVSVPLFTKDGNYYRWAHKSIQEYFAAQFIFLDAKTKQESILNKMYWSADIEKYANILDIYYDVDYRSFRNVIVKNLVDEYIHHSKQNYNKQYLNVDPDEIVLRKELLFFTNAYVIKTAEYLRDGIKIINLLEEYKKKNLFKRNSYTEMKSRIFQCTQFTSPKLILLDILYAKKNELVRGISISGDDEIILDEIKMNEGVEITDNPKISINLGENFKKANYLLAITNHFQILINHNYATQLKVEIDRDIEIEKENDFLLDGLD